MSQPSQPAANVPPRKKGFAVVVSLVLMAFLVLLMLSLSSLVSVQTRVATATRGVAEARQNALYGLEVALGELQRHLGADQAITAPATTVFPDKDTLIYSGPGSLYQSNADTAQSRTFLDNGRTWLTPDERDDFDQDVKDWWAEGDKQPHWTGVYAGYLRRDDEDAVRYEDDPDDTLFGEPKRDQLPAWLVSGNENLGFNLGETAYPTDYLTPEDISGIPAADRVTLVGTGSAPENTGADPSVDGIDGTVVVKRMPIGDDGHYAFWVGDESTKFNLQVPDPYRDEDDPTDPVYRNRLLTPVYAGWRGFTPFQDLLSGSDIDGLIDNQDGFERLTNLEQITILDNDLRGTGPDFKDAAARQLFHHATLNSFSLLTDPVLGGLKKDLTRYLTDGSGLIDSDPIMEPDRYASDDPRFNVYAATPGPGSGFPTSGDNLPTWGDLREWYQNDAEDSDTAPVDASIEFAPIITRYAFYGGFSYDSVTETFYFHWFPIITLWNPYDTAINSTTYEISVPMHFQMNQLIVVSDTGPGTWQYTPDTGGNFHWHSITDVFNGDLIPLEGGLIDDDGPLDDDLAGAPWIGEKDDKDKPRQYTYRPFGDNGLIGNTTFTYRITSSFEPGESLVFAINPDSNIEFLDFTLPPYDVELENFFSVTEPGHLSFPAFKIENGPVATADLRVHARFAADVASDGLVGFPNEVEYRIGPADPIEIKQFGFEFNTQSNSRRLTSYEYKDAHVGGSKPKYLLGNDPSILRKIYPKEGYVDPLIFLSGNNSDPNEAESPMFHFGTFYLNPLIGRQPIRINASSHTRFLRFFALRNPRARFLRDHPLEYNRNRFATSNTDKFGKSVVAQARDSNGQRGTPFIEDWSFTDTTTVGGKVRGFSLLTDQEEIVEDTSLGIIGLSEMSVYNARRSASNILSIAQLNSANVSKFYFQPGFAIGNSEASPYVDRAGVAGLTAYKVGAQFKSGPSYTTQTWPNERDSSEVELANVGIDVSYLLNENLWDRFFLSGIQGSVDLDDPDDFPNPRLRPLFDDGSIGDSEVRDYDLAAAHLGMVGGFNVNSTSKEAWKSLLMSFQDLQIESQSSDENPAETAPISRTFDPVTDAVDFAYDASFTAASENDEKSYGAEGSADALEYDEVLGGFRYLTEPMIDELAERIVDEVRLRGPFFSVADFINRRLVAPDGVDDEFSAWYEARTSNPAQEPAPGDNTAISPIDNAYDPVTGLTGLNGALQRALNLSGINGGVNYPGTETEIEADRIFGLVWPANPPADLHAAAKAGPNLFGRNHIAYPAMRSYLDAEHLAGAPASEAGHLFSHAPGFVTQANVLGMIGAVLTARGDTFKIRTYGDVADPITGQPLAKAWLEATVQRVPDPVERASEVVNTEEYWQPTSEFGRQFRILSIRWLSEDEI